jgi:hypothetical protein
MRSFSTVFFGLAALAFVLCADRPMGSVRWAIAAETKTISTVTAEAPKTIKALTIQPATTAGSSKEECEKNDTDASQKMIQDAQAVYEKEKREMQERLSKDPLWQPTYEQVSVVKVNELAPGREINSFCLNKDGNLLVCCGPKSASLLGTVLGKPNARSGGIVQFSGDGKLLGEWKLAIEPQAICIGSDGTVYVGGAGKLLKLDQAGSVLQSSESPNMAELPPLPTVEKKPKLTGREAEKAEKARQKEIAELQKQQQAVMQEYQKVAQQAAKTIKANDDASMAEYQAKMAPQIEKVQEISARLQEAIMTPEMLAAQLQAARDQMTTITGMAVTAQDVFVCCRAAKGYGYVVWRVDHDFANPKRIVENLAGCCLQMDIQAHEGDLWIAHNSRHKVEHYSRDGKKRSSFGKTDRIAPDGFGGCCEPKNLRFGPGNVVFACESGPPTCVKQFSLAGKFLGVAVVAPWNSGCVRVTTEYDAQRDRFFVLNAGDKTIHLFAKKPAGKDTAATSPKPAVSVN